MDEKEVEDLKKKGYIPVGTVKDSRDSDTLYNRIEGGVPKETRASQKTFYNRIKRIRDSFSQEQQNEYKDDFITGPNQKLYVSQRMATILDDYFYNKYEAESYANEVVDESYVNSRITYVKNVFKKLKDESDFSEQSLDSLNKILVRYNHDLEWLESLYDELNDLISSLESRRDPKEMYKFLDEISKKQK
ncbi:hypothetical protein [Limosilactobacillus reuteri]|uniref:hypothetical protein n=1 Tax=Limosilactobacillus reuteri TaxID=1598 RepID=UPI001E3761DB|nr:hypothetical protein [Limosilactobacillus reuteri]MCC4371768.1 hypothetical protein [Limosilactobacillus reuteri]MCC4399240.1 hypothetical protein [Limosilactobacillus reuteri]MCC4404120.1 hypothetical protein [Limosilactobacillus reuteri]MCC4502296.1 hypothetical protein [Limosilactobacillus reuteri]